jgi:hypothetical protein
MALKKLGRDTSKIAVMCKRHQRVFGEDLEELGSGDI